MKERWQIGLLVALALGVYANTFGNDFAYDDELYILRNPAVTHPSLPSFFLPIRANVVRPVTFASLALNWQFAGAHPLLYHVCNALLHAAVTLLLYLLLRTLLASLPEGPTVAFVGALLFAVHPIHTEAVASAVGRSELLAAGFLLAAWVLHSRDQPVAELVCLLFALMSKESAAVFLPLVLAGDYACDRLKPLGRYLSIAAVSAAYLAAFWKLKGGRFGEVTVAFLSNPLSALPVNLRILNAVRIAWKYVELQLYPAKLSYDYSYNGILLYSNWRHGAAAVAGAALVVACWLWVLLARRTGWALAGALYLIGFSVTSNIFVTTGTIMGERLAYLPSAGLCLAIALLWMELAKRYRRLAWVALGAVVALFGFRTVLRNRDWHDNSSLFLADLPSVPGSAKIHTNAGVIYMNRGQLEQARAEFLTSLRIYRDSPETIEAYGFTEALRGEDQEGLGLLQTALAMTPRNELNYDFRAVNLAAEFMKLGKNDEALAILDTEIQQGRADARAWSNRAVIHQQRGESELARADAESVLRLDPANAQAQSVLRQLSPDHPTR